MYEAFFGLTRAPFSIAPDPQFLYLSERHREALALLADGLARGASFVLLTGEIGAGKTTVWRHFLEDLPSDVDVANVVNPKLGVDALLRRVFEDLQVELPAGGSTVDMIDALHGHLLLAHGRGRRLLIVIDEAQALAPEVLEQLRLLTNLDWSGRMLQVLLIAQPEMRQLLERPELEPLAQRIVARYHLAALTERESAAYVAHRLQVAGMTAPQPFDGEAMAMVHRVGRGIPRRINVLCDRALTLAERAGTRRIGREIVARAATQAFGEGGPRALPGAPNWPRPLAMAGAAGLAFAAGAWLLPPLGGPFGTRPAPASAPTGSGPAAAAASPTPASAPGRAPTTEEATAQARTMGVAIALPSTTDAEVALQRLAQGWGAAPIAADFCSAAPRQGLACYRARGGMATMRQLDRPCMLHLVDAQGRTAYTLLVGLREETATVAAGGEQREVALAALAGRWHGEFTTLWRTPPGWRGEATGADAAGLADQLARAGFGAAAGTPAERLRAFQAAQGLTPDGVAGPLTLMRLNRVAGPEEPRL